MPHHGRLVGAGFPGPMADGYGIRSVLPPHPASSRPPSPRGEDFGAARMALIRHLLRKCHFPPREGLIDPPQTLKSPLRIITPKRGFLS